MRYSTSYKRKQRALYKLEGQKIIKTTINPITAATQWEFDLGGILSVRRKKMNTQDYLWSLYYPNGHAFSVRADGKYHYDLMDKTIDEIVWKTFDSSK